MTEFMSKRTRGWSNWAATLMAGGLLCLMLACMAKAQAAAEAAGATSMTTSAAAAVPKATVPPEARTKPAISSPHITAAMNAVRPEANRAALEAKAGRDAAHLLLRSTPSQAQVWVDGSAVGTTPLLMILAPGKYRIELRGVKQEHAERECALLPRETQEVVMNLQKMYPNRIFTH
jgi:hypothetical protein